MSARHSSQQSHLPIRRCIICRTRAPKPELLRVVRRPDGEITVSARDEGRGAYIHSHPRCLGTAAAQPKYLARALRRPPPDAMLNRLDRLATAEPVSPATHITRST